MQILTGGEGGGENFYSYFHGFLLNLEDLAIQHYFDLFPNYVKLTFQLRKFRFLLN